MSDTWFTSDIHFNHTKICEYTGRPFTNVHDMNEALVENWNDRVKPGDDIYVLGDFCMGQGVKQHAPDFAKRLNGRKHLVWGNHDEALRKVDEFKGHWVWYRDLATIKVNNQRIVMCHYPMVVWDGSHRGSWMLHGHCHGSLKDDPTQLRTDVGVDCWDLRPVHFDELSKLFSIREYKPVDHHGL